jgi:uncharacterized glyoxalase superfamily protein PhnB
MVNPIPEGYPRVTPYLIVDGASAAIDFYKSVLGATERMRMGGPEGKVGHAELEIGDSVVMLADEHPEIDAGAQDLSAARRYRCTSTSKTRMVSSSARSGPLQASAPGRGPVLR